MPRRRAVAEQQQMRDSNKTEKVLGLATDRLEEHSPVKDEALHMGMM